ncbi:MAG: TIGR00341 family protein [Leptospirales bacterium]
MSNKKQPEKKTNSKKADLQKKGAEKPGYFKLFLDSWKDNKTNKENPEKKTGVLDTFVKAIDETMDKKEKQDQNQDTYEIVAAGSRLTLDFFVLLLGSTFIATFGLLQNSAAVIIGAMIIAPLMGPILGFSLGSIWGDRSLLGTSIFTLFVGTLSGLVLATAISFALPGIEINGEMSSRINPNLYDILIALSSGVVGAYAFVNPRILSSVSGVAIAVALVPPLAVTGISLGQLDFRSAYGAFLLYCSNLVGISLAASFVFWRMKVHPILHDQDEVNTRAKRKFVLATIVLILIAIPLGFFMRDSLYIKSHEREIRKHIELNLENSQIDSLQIVKYIEGYKVNCTLIIPGEPTPEALAQIKTKIESMFDQKTEIHLIILQARIL